MNPIFGSKKVTVTIIGAAVAFAITVVTALQPDVDPSAWQNFGEALMHILTVYLAGQSAIDVTKELRQNING